MLEHSNQTLADNPVGQREENSTLNELVFAVGAGHGFGLWFFIRFDNNKR